MGLADRVKQLRNKKELTQVELAKLANATQQVIQRIESGQTKSGRYINSIAKALDVSVGWLVYGDRQSEDAEASLRKLPVLDWINARHGSAPIEIPPSELEYVYVPKTICGPHSFILIVKGDLMQSNIPGQKSFLPGEKIGVDPDKNPNSGNFVIALLDDNSEPVFKQYVTDGPKQYLKPLNLHYPIIEMSANIKIIGVVFGHIDYNLCNNQ